MWRAPSILIAVVLILISLGIVMLASTSAVKGHDDYRDSLHFLKRQLMWLAIGLVAATLSSIVIDYHTWGRKSVVIAMASLSALLLGLMFTPLGHTVGGATRWLRIGSFRVGQPSEVAKFTVVLVTSAWMTHVGPRARRLVPGLLVPLGAIGVFCVLIILEPDFGTTALVGVVGMAIMFAGGTRLAHLVVSATLLGSGFVVLIMQDANRMGRIMAFLNPNEHSAAAYQLRQSLESFVLGGGWGVGLGRSIQKLYYLPEAHTDFILAIIGEELGIGATITVVLLFAAFLLCGLVISFNAPDMFGRLMGFGLTVMITLQAAINIGVVTGCLPTKGLPLPFISAGGSNLVMCLFSAGVLINIARHSSGEIDDKHGKSIKDGVQFV